ncbi:MAG TPA: hypothetical protein VM577_10715 [Anaerovoracaceae bacterium]|nr:hypothetical protein [Anaerovoracaceae bacterium]
MDMRIPLEVTAEGMERTDDTGSKGFLMIEGVHPVGNNLSRGFEENIKKPAVTTKKLTELLWNRKDNVPMTAVNQLCSDGIGAVGLISGAAGIAETGFAAEGYIMEMITVMAVVETIALFQIAAMKHLLNLSFNNGTNAWIGRKERGPVILENLPDGKL